MKRVIWWAVIALVLGGLLWGALRLWPGRRDAAPPPPAKAEAVVELAATDLVVAAQRNLAQGLPVSGSLKAVQSALVKARVPGELQGLTLREGDAVKAGQIVARVDAGEYQSRVRQAQEQADAARAQIDIAQRQWDNNKALVDQGFISRTALDTSLSNLNAAKANHKAALAAVEVARKSLDDTALLAPISGVVAQRLAQPGERVGVDARILEIVDLGRLELEATLSGADSVAVRVGQAAQLQIEGTGRPVMARVVRINPTAQAGSRSVLVYLALENAQGLRQGLFAQGALDTGRSNLLAVPLSAVRTDKPQPYLQLMVGGRVVHQTVQTGLRGTDPADANGETLVAIEGVAAGAQVLRGHLGSLREGSQVRQTAAPQK